MSEALPVAYLARHGGTAWTVSGQHTGLTDLPLTAQGEAEAIRLGERLEGLRFAAVLTSPLRRAVRTCELAGFSSAAEVESDLVEWNYGAYEGRTSPNIHVERPTGSCSATLRREGSRPSRSALGARLETLSSRRCAPEWLSPSAQRPVARAA
jgi:broad specificity phosphatase PhoE